MQDRLSFKAKQLENGITLHVHQMDVPFFCLEVMFPVGSIHSTEENPGGKNGVAHFLEHTVLNRSEAYPEKHGFDRFVALHGGYINASTGPFHTRFKLQGPTSMQEDFLKGFISQIYHPIFKESDIAIERGVVSNERRQKKYYPGRTEISHYINTKWLNHTYVSKEQVFGTDEDLAACTEQSLDMFQDTYYTPEAVVVASGNISEELLEKIFGSIKTKSTSLRGSANPIEWSNRTYHEQTFKDIDHPIYLIGGFSPKYDFETETLLCFMGDYLTNPFTGVLHHWLRNEKGWTYGLHTNVETHADRIKWLLEFPMNDLAAVTQMREELLKRIRAALTDAEAINLEIERQLNRLVFALQTAETRLDAAIDSLQDMGRIPSEAELREQVRSITSEKLLKVFEEQFSPSSMGELLALPLE